MACEALELSGEFYFEGFNPKLQKFFGTDSLSGHGKAMIKFGMFCLRISVYFHQVTLNLHKYCKLRVLLR